MYQFASLCISQHLICRNQGVNFCFWSITTQTDGRCCGYSTATHGKYSRSYSGNNLPFKRRASRLLPLDCFFNEFRDSLKWLCKSRRYFFTFLKTSAKCEKNMFKISPQKYDICKERWWLCTTPEAKYSIRYSEEWRKQRAMHCHLFCSFHVEQIAALSTLITNQGHIKAL